MNENGEPRSCRIDRYIGVQYPRNWSLLKQKSPSASALEDVGEGGRSQEIIRKCRERRHHNSLHISVLERQPNAGAVDVLNGY